MPVIPPSKEFEGSSLDGRDEFKQTVQDIDWAFLSKMLRKNTAFSCLRLGHDLGLPADVVIPIVQAAVEATGTTYKQRFYIGGYHDTLKHFKK